MADNYLLKKAELILGGDIRIPEGYTNSLFEMKGGSPRSAVLTFGPCRQRKRISEDGEFLLRSEGDSFVLERNGEIFLRDVGLKRMFCHSPDLAVINLAKEDTVLTTEDALELLRKYGSQAELKGISLHGGEPCSIDHYIEVVEAFHRECPELPIGVGSTTFTRSDMERMVSAGAVDMKSSVLSPVKRIMEVADSAIDLEERKRHLSEAVEVFGRNRVVCSFFIGMGETQGEFLEGLEGFCALGVMPDIKFKKLRGGIREAIESAYGKPEPVTPVGYADLMEKVRDMMQRYGLDPRGYETMCYGCRCCNIVPFRDF